LSFVLASLLLAAEAHCAQAQPCARANDWLGARALDRRGEPLGILSELVLEPRAGAVQYAVVRSEGWLWLSGLRRIYPITAVSSAMPGLVRVQVDKADLGKQTGVEPLESRLRPYQPHASHDGQHAPASKIIGSVLVDARGEALGAIDDLIFDARNGALRWVVAESIAFPAGGLQPQAGGGYRPGKPRNARAMSPPQWPSMRASALLGKEVIDRRHRDFGKVRDLRVDLEGARVEAALVDRRDDWMPGEALVAVPIEAFSLPRDLPDKIAINYSRERFTRRP
jgi:sporulation protein YlmC with PRC-barrel domain